MSNVTVTSPASIILARPSAETTDLPDGWTWWDDGIRHIDVDERPWVREQPPADRILAHRPPRWERLVTADELEQLTGQAIREYRAGDAGLLNQLPPRHRSQALVRLGYSAIGHELMHTSQWPSGPAATTPLPAFGGGRMIAQYTFDGAVRLSYDASRDHPSVRQVQQEDWRTIPAGLVRAENDQWGNARFADPAERRVRAVAGTSLPGRGWQLTEPRNADGYTPLDSLASTAPLSLDRVTAAGLWVDHLAPASDLLYVVLRPTPGGWSYGTGIGGFLRVHGQRPDRQAAETAGRAALRVAQDQAWERARQRCGGRTDWTGWGAQPPAAQVVVCAAHESSYEALARCAALS